MIILDPKYTLAEHIGTGLAVVTLTTIAVVKFGIEFMHQYDSMD